VQVHGYGADLKLEGLTFLSSKGSIPIGKMPYSSKAVANTLLDFADAENIKLTPMKLLKLVYFAHGWHLALRNEPLIDERIEAWKFGPVVPRLYHQFKSDGTSGISDRAYDWHLRDKMMTRTEPRVPEGWTSDFLKKVLSVYGGFSGPQLSALTHEAGTPWHNTWTASGQFAKGTDIPDDEIKSYFLRKSKNV
jgi:uncharacterized phage-associated protein